MDKYKNEYLNLINDDEVFADIWQDSEEDFAEWCQIHDIKINKGGKTMTKYKIIFQDTMISYYLDVEFNSYDEAWDYMQENNLIDCYEID